MRRHEDGRYLDFCPFCGEETYYDGHRRYWPEGFPHVHECKPSFQEPVSEKPKAVQVKQDKGLDL